MKSTNTNTTAQELQELTIMQGIASALVRSAYRAAMRHRTKAGAFVNSDVAALEFAYMSDNNREDNEQTAFVAYMEQMRRRPDERDIIALADYVPPRVAAYRALSRSVYANKAKTAKYDPSRVTCAYAVDEDQITGACAFDAATDDVAAAEIETRYSIELILEKMKKEGVNRRYRTIAFFVMRGRELPKSTTASEKQKAMICCRRAARELDITYRAMTDAPRKKAATPTAR